VVTTERRAARASSASVFAPAVAADPSVDAGRTAAVRQALHRAFRAVPAVRAAFAPAARATDAGRPACWVSLAAAAGDTLVAPARPADHRDASHLPALSAAHPQPAATRAVARYAVEKPVAASQASVDVGEAASCLVLRSADGLSAERSARMASARPLRQARQAPESALRARAWEPVLRRAGVAAPAVVLQPEAASARPVRERVAVARPVRESAPAPVPRRPLQAV